jgi:type IV secretory pathway VirB10-like protein
MKFKDIFDKEVIVEQHVRKGLKIIYELDLNLVKPQQEENQEQPQQIAQQPAPAAAQPAQQPQAVPEQPVPAETPAPEQPQEQPAQPQDQQIPNEKPDLSGMLASIKTEESAAETSEEKIMRHFKGEYVCSNEQADNIQSFDDLLNILGETKKDGVNILDDFSKEIILLCANQKYDDIKTKLDKKSKIFAEIYFGYKKDDSVGVRFKKGENMDTLSSSILINNQIVTLSKFNLERVNQKIIEYRNYEADKEKS